MRLAGRGAAGKAAEGSPAFNQPQHLGARSHTHSLETETVAQNYAKQLLHSDSFEHVMGVIIVLNFVVVIVETDKNSKEEEIPKWLEVSTWVVLISFVLELVLRIFALRHKFHHEFWNLFDLVVIGVDFIMSVLSAIYEDLFNVSCLRILRLCRLARATKLVQVFPELRLMLAGLAGALHAIFWGTVLLFTVVLIWSVMAVQFIHPLNVDIAKNGGLTVGCGRCERAFESTFQAALTFCTQIVAGDSWGRETVPIIENYPVTAFFFAGVYCSVGLATLNLILGVVVNVATEERERLVKQMAEEKSMKRLEAHDQLHQMCQEMDEDGNDELTMEEIKHGYDHNELFRATLDKMEIGRDDLDVVWTILDSDKSGTITSKEFVTQVYKMKSSDTQFMLAYIKFYVCEIKDKLRQDLQKIQKKMDIETGEAEANMKKADGDVSQVPQRSASSDSMPKELKAEQKDRHDTPLQVEMLKLSIEANKISQDPSPNSNPAQASSPGEQAELLSQLSSVWKECIASIGDVDQRHKNITKLLTVQSKYLGAIIPGLSDFSPLTGPPFATRDLDQLGAKACYVCGALSETAL